MLCSITLWNSTLYTCTYLLPCKHFWYCWDKYCSQPREKNLVCIICLIYIHYVTGCLPLFNYVFVYHFHLKNVQPFRLYATSFISFFFVILVYFLTLSHSLIQSRNSFMSISPLKVGISTLICNSSTCCLLGYGGMF